MMEFWLQMSFLFFIGCFGGWGAEVLFRKFCCPDTNPEHHWINPGFLTGPYLPLYGFGLTAMYLICSIPWEITVRWKLAVVVVLTITVAMTVIEYIAGLIFVRGMKLKLWDYSDLPGNIQGIICPQFTALWGVCGAVYYFLIHPYIQHALDWFGRNLAFSFVVGFFYGVFTIDLVYTTQLVHKIRAFAKENNLVVRYEELKADIKERAQRQKQRMSFVFAFRSGEPLLAHLERYAKQYQLSGRMRRRGKHDKKKRQD